LGGPEREAVTAQIDDIVNYADASWSLAGVNGNALFDPKAHGIVARPASTACWRGFVCTYALRDGALFLDEVDVALDVTPPPLFGVEAQSPHDPLEFTASYKSLARPVSFTGGILLARGFLKRLYVHMGFHPAWKYKHVLEVELEAGCVRSVSDCTQAMADIRNRLSGKDRPESGASVSEISAWIERAFSRKY
jgi:hypothetical protein